LQSGAKVASQAHICVVKGDSILFAVDEVECGDGSKQSQWISTLHQPNIMDGTPVIYLQLKKASKRQDMVFGLTEGP